MRKEILKFVHEAKRRYGIQCFYIADGDVWCLHKNGYAVQNFTTDIFHQIPPVERMRMLLPLMTIGINHNLGERTYQQVEHLQQYGQRIT